MVEKARCEICDRTFKAAEGLVAHNAAKHPERVSKEKKPFPVKKVRNWGLGIVIVGLVIFGAFWLISSILNAPSLPPTDMANHIEVSPSSHVLREPMDIRIHKHMLEHSDGTGPPGIIINYNCEDFNCEIDLVEKLESFVEKYPLNVYVAPFPNMGAKITLTRLNKIEVLEEYNEQTIENFINTGR